MSAVAAAAAPTVRPKVGRDEWTMRALMAVIGLYLLAALALPLYVMLSKSFEDEDGAFIGLANYQEYFATPALAHSIGNSLQVATITTLITVVLAFTFAYALTRSCVPFKGLFRTIAMMRLSEANSWISGTASLEYRYQTDASPTAMASLGAAS